MEICSFLAFSAFLPYRTVFLYASVSHVFVFNLKFSELLLKSRLLELFAKYHCLPGLFKVPSHSVSQNPCICFLIVVVPLLFIVPCITDITWVLQVSVQCVQGQVDGALSNLVSGR